MARKKQSREERRAKLRVIQARYRARHRDELNAKRRARYWRDLEKTREQQRRSNKNYREKHKDELRAKNAVYRENNRDKLLANMKLWRQRNIEAERARDRARSRQGYREGNKLEDMREWRRRNPEKVRAFLRASFHKRRGQIGEDSFSAAEWLALRNQYGNLCAYCGRSGPLTVDHRLPLSRGGRNVIANVLPACKSCNSRKHTRTEKEFRALLLAESIALFAELFAALRVGPASRISDVAVEYRAA